MSFLYDLHAYATRHNIAKHMELARRGATLLTGLVLIVAMLSALPNVAKQAVGEPSPINVDITQGASTKTTDAYSPNPVQASIGDTVIWTNKDATIHTATSGTAAGGPTGLFG